MGKKIITRIILITLIFIIGLFIWGSSPVQVEAACTGNWTCYRSVGPNCTGGVDPNGGLSGSWFGCSYYQGICQATWGVGSCGAGGGPYPCVLDSGCTEACAPGNCGNYGGCYEVSGSCVKSGWDGCASCWDYCSPGDAGCYNQACPSNCGYGGGNVNDGTLASGCGCGTKYCSPVVCATLTCSVTGSLTANAGVPEPYSAHSTISDGSINKTELFWSPTSFSNWTQISAFNGPDTSGNATFPSTGTYWVVGNAFDTTRGLACSGNPFGLPAGWQDCGPGCRKQVTVPTPTPTLPIPPTIIPTPPIVTPPGCPVPDPPTGLLPSGTLACVDTDTSTVNFSWNPVFGAPACPVTKYAIRIDRKDNGWSGDCTALNPGDYCNDNVFSNSFSRILDTNYNYEFWVHAINNIGWGLPTYQTFSLPKCSTPTIPLPTLPPVNNPIGWHDDSNCSISSGWTCDADNYTTSLTIHLYKDGPFGVGTYMGSTVASIPAEKGVCDACGGTCNHRWTFTTPEDMKDGISHTIYAYGINIGGGNNVLLSSTPRTILCAPPVLIGFVQGRKGIVSTSAGGGSDYFEEVGVVSSAVRLTDPLGGYEPPDPNTANPFLFSNLILQSGRMRTLSVANVAYYERGWTRCYNNAGCHGIPADITPGSSVPISESSMIGSPPVSNPYADAWFHFTPLPRCQIVDGPSTIEVGYTADYTAQSFVDLIPNVNVQNQLGIFKTTPNFMSPTVPTKTIGGGLPIGTIINYGNTATSPLQKVTIDTTGLTAGTRFYVYCRAANGTLTNPPSLLPVPPARLHECNPFCIAGSGGCDNVSGESTPSYRLHPFDYNCNVGLGNDWMLVEIVDTDWWQTQHGNVTAAGGGRIVSGISGIATNNRPYLIDNNTSLYPDPYAYPGVLAYGSATSPDLGAGYLSSSYGVNLRQWNVKAGSSVTLPLPTFFEKKFPQDVRDAMNGPNKITDGTLTGSELIAIGAGTGYTMASGYYVYAYNGTTVLNIGESGVVDELTVLNGKKIIIYAPNADVNINAPIHFSDGKAFFMLIAGGDISVNAEVGGSPVDVGESSGSKAPDLEGVFYANGQFSSGSSNTQLHVRGIVAANSISLQRNLMGGSWENSKYPGELFEYDPAQTLMFPAFLSLKTYSRQEVAP